jgi:nitrogen regulatory protein P-II 1
MKEIKAYIRKDKANVVIQQLEQAGVSGMTILDVNALAEWADKKAFSYSIEYVQKYSTVVKIELICEDSETDNLVQVISESGKTGHSGDGWIFVSKIDRAVSIKTGKNNN